MDSFFGLHDSQSVHKITFFIVITDTAIKKMRLYLSIGVMSNDPVF